MLSPDRDSRLSPHERPTVRRKAKKTRKCPISWGPRRASKTRSERHAALSARPHAAPPAALALPLPCATSAVKRPADHSPNPPAAAPQTR
eukprot:2121275-Prymnesium_polylepis.1